MVALGSKDFVLVGFANTKRELGVPEPQVLGRQEPVQKVIDAVGNSGRRSNHAVVTRRPVEQANKVREKVEHCQVVFNGDDVLVVVDELSDR